MKNKKEPDMKPEYSREKLGKGIRGKYLAKVKAGSEYAVLDETGSGGGEMARGAREKGRRGNRSGGV